uniref:Uncharacterized protein n=1 Tax=Arundo donax TaxID=35708 RepID=A0A0A8Z8T8_ARUDO
MLLVNLSRQSFHSWEDTGPVFQLSRRQEFTIFVKSIGTVNREVSIIQQ